MSKVKSGIVGLILIAVAFYLESVESEILYPISFWLGVICLYVTFSTKEDSDVFGRILELCLSWTFIAIAGAVFYFLLLKPDKIFYFLSRELNIYLLSKVAIAIIVIFLLIYFKNRMFQENVDENTPLSSKYINMSIRKHNKQLFKTDNINMIRMEKERLADDFKIAQRLYHFVDDIKHYPHWYKNSTNDDGTPYWRIKAINPDDIILKKYSEIKYRFLMGKKVKADEEVIEYRFKVNNKVYTVEFYRSIGSPDFYIGERCPSSYVVTIIDDEFDLVFGVELFYGSDEYRDYYSYYNLKAFEPGDWLKFLIDKMATVREEEKLWGEEYMEKLHRERQEAGSN